MNIAYKNPATAPMSSRSEIAEPPLANLSVKPSESTHRSRATKMVKSDATQAMTPSTAAASQLVALLQ